MNKTKCVQSLFPSFIREPRLDITELSQMPIGL